MPGEPDPEYVVARRVLLDALDALQEQLEAVVLVGAQAIYLRVGEGDLAVAPFTTDGDIALDPSAIVPTPRLEEAFTRAGFVRDLTQPGVWLGELSRRRRYRHDPGGPRDRRRCCYAVGRA